MSYLQDFLDKAEYKAIAEIDYNDLDRLITNFFRAEIDQSLPYYEMVAYEEWGNYQKHSFDLVKDDQDDIDDANETIEDLRASKKWGHYRTSDLLNYMCQKGALPECELIVNISW